jgi:hypothetical protein
MRLVLPCTALVLVWAGNARADLTVSIQEGANTPTIVSTTDSPTGGIIALNGTFAGAPDFFFDGFTLTSTLTGPTPGNITGTGTIDSGAAGTLTILVSDNLFVNPPGPHYQLNSTSSYTGSFPHSSTDSLSFQSFAAAGSDLFGTSFPSPGHTYSPLGGNGAFNEASTLFTAPSGYTLTQKYVWVSNASGDALQPTGSTTAIFTNAIPEPSSLALFGLGSLGSFVILHRRRRRA